MHGAVAEWSTTDHLLATVVDLLALGNWQRGGGKGSRPKPLRRPGVDDRAEKRYGGTTLPLDEARRRVERRRHGRRPLHQHDDAREEVTDGS